MSRRPAHFTQADIARAIRALKQTGAPFAAVEMMPDGTVRVIPLREAFDARGGRVAEKLEIVL